MTCVVYLQTGRHEDSLVCASSATDGRDDQGVNLGATLSHTFVSGRSFTLEERLVFKIHHFPEHYQAAPQQLFLLFALCTGMCIPQNTGYDLIPPF